MKITIIGANSYIARNLIYYIKSRYKDVDLRLFDCQKRHVDEIENYKRINVSDHGSLSRADLKCDVIFIFTGKTGSAAGFDDADTFIDLNEKSLLHILNEYRKQKSEAKIIYPSTRLVYKGAEKLLKEDDEKEFRTIYAMNKYACEWYLKQYSRAFAVKYCVLRICVPYGSMIKGASCSGTVEFMLHKARNRKNITIYGNGQVKRTLTHIEDLCSCMYAAALSDKCVNDVYNIDGEIYSLADMAETIADQFGTGVDYISYPSLEGCIESGSTIFDGTKLNSRIGYVRVHTFTEWCENQCVKE